MGYHVAIIRAVPITKDEVVALACDSEEWKYDPEQNALVSRHDTTEAAALWFSDGELWTKNPTEELITKMITLAEKLKARVRGDELETYRSATETYFHLEDRSERDRADTEAKSVARRFRIRQWLFNAAVMGTFLLVILFLKWVGFLDWHR
jgi:hypothetical protein